MTASQYSLPLRLSRSFQSAIDYIFKNTISEKVLITIKENFIVLKYSVLNDNRTRHRSYLKAHQCETVSTVVSNESTTVRVVFGINNIVEQYFDYSLKLINSTFELISKTDFPIFYKNLNTLIFDKQH